MVIGHYKNDTSGPHYQYKLWWYAMAPQPWVWNRIESSGWVSGLICFHALGNTGTYHLVCCCMQSPQHMAHDCHYDCRKSPPQTMQKSIFSLIHSYNHSFIRSTWYGGGGKNKETHIAETCVLIHGLDSGGYNSNLFGILLRKLKAAPVDVISNKGHVDLCTWFVARNFHGGMYLGWAFWWVTSYGFCRSFSLQTAEKPTVNCFQVSSWRQCWGRPAQLSFLIHHGT